MVPISYSGSQLACQRRHISGQEVDTPPQPSGCSSCQILRSWVLRPQNQRSGLWRMPTALPNGFSNLQWIESQQSEPRRATTCVRAIHKFRSSPCFVFYIKYICIRNISKERDLQTTLFLIRKLFLGDGIKPIQIL